MNKEEVIREIQRLNDLYIKESDEKILYSKDVVNQLIFAKTNKLEQENQQLKEKVGELTQSLNEQMKLTNEENLDCSKYAVENKQLKLDYELYKDNCVHRNYEVEIRDNTIKQLKEVIEEVRGIIESGLDFDNPQYADECKKELLQILDKIKENK